MLLHSALLFISRQSEALCPLKYPSREVKCCAGLQYCILHLLPSMFPSIIQQSACRCVYWALITSSRLRNSSILFLLPSFTSLNFERTGSGEHAKKEQEWGRKGKGEHGAALHPSSVLSSTYSPRDRRIQRGARPYLSLAPVPSYSSSI